MSRKSWRKSGYRSGLELRLKENIQERLKKKALAKIRLGYEDTKLPYVTEHLYTPDFTLEGNKIIYLEAKGNFDSADRSKHLALKEQHPDLDIRFVFQRDNPIRKGSKTTYSMWAEKLGFKWCIGEDVPDEWLKELK